MKSMRLIFSILAFILLPTLGVVYAAITTDEAFSRIQRLQEQNKIPAYILDQGTYKYVEGVSTAHVQGKNVFMRSQPLKNARIITKLNHVDLKYLGEWTHPENGEKWVCVEKNGEIGWIYGQYVILVKETGIKNASVQPASEENTKYKRNKDCTEDPCGALGGFLLISPILYLIDLIDKEKKKNPSKTVAKYGKDSDIDDVDDDVNFWDKCCPGYKYLKCYECDNYDEHDTPLEHYGYAKCNHFKGYVYGSYSPRYNAEHVESFADECCPSHRKAHCGACDYIDMNDEYHGYYRCGYFYAYVDADCSPQHNSKNLKYP